MNDDLVLGAMGITGATVFLAEGYLDNYRAWIIAKTRGTPYTQQHETSNFWKWAFGLGVVTVVLVAAADSEAEPVAHGIAVLAAISAVLLKGQDAYKQLKGLVVP